MNLSPENPFKGSPHVSEEDQAVLNRVLEQIEESEEADIPLEQDPNHDDNQHPVTTAEDIERARDAAANPHGFKEVE
jgi:hypothetical protein